MCDYFKYTRAAYYKSLKEHEEESFSEALVIDLVRRERHQQPRIGGKKLYFMLSSEIHNINPHLGRNKFFDFLRKNGLLVKRKRQYQKTTNSYHHFHKYGNKIKELAEISPNQVWASDITYLRTRMGFVYLSLITDMYSRKIVGLSLCKNLTIEGPMDALKKALRKNPTKKPLIHHSDRGIQYCSHDYVKILKKKKIEISMTEENHCYENAMAERVNGILKDEYLLDRTFNDFDHANKACREAVKLYNTRRPHLALDFKTPEEVYQEA